MLLKNLILFSGIFITFSSCKSQIKTENLEIQGSNDTIGQIVLELDKAILSVYQDQKNQYWFGSNGKGVFYYNGKSITNFTIKDGLAGNQIRGIQGDKSGNLYFDTPDGVSKYDGVGFTTLKPIYSSENEWKSAAKDLWFKGNGDSNGVYRYGTSSIDSLGQVKSLFHLTFPEKNLKEAFGIEFEETPYSPYGVYGIYKDKKENIWFGTLSAGVYRFDGDSLFWIAEKELTVLEDGRAPGVRSIIEDKDGNFWFSNILNRYVISETKKGEITYEKLEGINQSEVQTKINLPYFMSAVTDNKMGDLWMSTYAEGVWRYDGENLFQYTLKDGKRGVLLYSIYKDNQGTIWLGTHNAGVYKYDGANFKKFIPKI